MQQNINPYSVQNPYQQAPASVTPNAVSINIFQPQAYGGQGGVQSQPLYQTQLQPQQQQQNFYPIYQPGQNPNGAAYPMNYNNLIQQPSYLPNALNGQQNEQDTNKENGNSANALGTTDLYSKTENPEEKVKSEEKADKKKEKEKTITILTDDYIKSLENYLNDSNPKVRLIGAKEVLERFKEDDSRTSNPSLNALLNKILRDTSPSVRFLGLTALQLGYSEGNDETVGILKEIQANNKDKVGEDSLLASEILLKLSAPQVKEVKE